MCVYIFMSDVCMYVNMGIAIHLWRSEEKL